MGRRRIQMFQKVKLIRKGVLTISSGETHRRERRISLADAILSLPGHFSSSEFFSWPVRSLANLNDSRVVLGVIQIDVLGRDQNVIDKD